MFEGLTECLTLKASFHSGKLSVDWNGQENFSLSCELWVGTNDFKGIWQYIFLLFHCKELLKLYVNLLYLFCVTILFLEIF